MQRLRVVHFGKFYPPHRGGMESVVASLCRGLVERAVQCRVIAAGEGLRRCVSIDQGVPVLRMRCLATIRSLPLCPEAVSALRRCDADVVHLQHPNPLADVACLSLPRGAKLVVTYQSDVVRQRFLAPFLAPLTRQTLKRADAIVATSRQYVASSATLRPFRSKVSVIPLGIALLPVPPLKAPFAAPGEPQYFFLGRLVPYKGLPVLLEALKSAPGRLWVGGSGPLEAHLRRLADCPALRDRVDFLGQISEGEKLRRFAQCDAFVLPSVTRAEAFGLVLLEAMAAARPVVVSDLPTGVRALVKDGVNGYRFPPGDSRALAEVLQRLADDPAGARRMGEEGRRRFLERWTLDRMVDGYVRLYERLCRRGSRAQARTPLGTRQEVGAA